MILSSTQVSFTSCIGSSPGLRLRCRFPSVFLGRALTSAPPSGAILIWLGVASACGKWVSMTLIASPMNGLLTVMPSMKSHYIRMDAHVHALLTQCNAFSDVTAYSMSITIDFYLPLKDVGSLRSHLSYPFFQEFDLHKNRTGQNSIRRLRTWRHHFCIFCLYFIDLLRLLAQRFILLCQISPVCCRSADCRNGLDHTLFNCFIIMCGVRQTTDHLPASIQPRLGVPLSPEPLCLCQGLKPQPAQQLLQLH